MKLFIGNLADTVDSTKLKKIFQPFTTITECDVVKNYAFIHIPDADVNNVISRLDGYTIEGKAIQIKLSTSKLRPVPGLSNQQCLRCTSTAHRTPQCPQDPANQVSHTIKIDLTRGLKREADSVASSSPAAPPVKRQYVITEEEIPRPAEPELQQLYEEYNLSRQRYTYYRDRLLKEIDAKRGPGNVFNNTAVPSTPAVIGSTHLSSAPVSYHSNAPVLNSYTVPTGGTGSHPYSSTLKAPYSAPADGNASPITQSVAGATAPYSAVMSAPVQTQPQAQMQSNSNTMTPQQYLQHSMAQGQPVATGPSNPTVVTMMSYNPNNAPQQQQHAPTHQVQSNPNMQQPAVYGNAPYSNQTPGAANIPWMQQQGMQQQQYQQQPQQMRQPAPQSAVMGGGLVKLNIT